MKQSWRKEALSHLLHLKESQAVRCSSWPSSLKTEQAALLQSGIARILTPPGKRSPYLVVIDAQKLDARIKSYVGEAPAAALAGRVNNLHKNGLTKAGGALPYMLLNILPGQTPWIKNGEPLRFTQHPDAYSGIIIEDENQSPRPTGDVLLVENREVWLKIRSKLPNHLQNCSIIHYEGWLSSRLLEALISWDKANIWLAPDYDPVGFQNFIKLQKRLPEVNILVPRITDDQICQWGSSEIWVNQVDYLYTVNQWCMGNSSPAASLFRRLARLGVGLEQEFLLGIPHLFWDLGKEASNEEYSTDQKSHPRTEGRVADPSLAKTDGSACGS